MYNIILVRCWWYKTAGEKQQSTKRTTIYRKFVDQHNFLSWFRW